MRKLATGWIAVFMFTGLATAQQKAPLSPKEILDRVTLVYDSCVSYLDEGQGVDELLPGFGLSKSSATAFVRPSRFRFEEAELWHGQKPLHYIAWKDDEVEKLWPPAAWRQPEQSRDEHSAFVEAIPRGGTTRIIMALLRPDLFRGDNLLAALTHVELAKMEKIEGRVAFKLDGKFMGEAVSVWIDQQTFLIVKIYLEEGKRRIVTVFKPQINLPITREQLAFNPPKVPAPISGPSNLEIISFDWSKKDKQVKLSSRHRYDLRIKNLSAKAIAGISWDYIVMEPASDKELGRKRLFTQEKVKPAEIKTLRVIDRFGPPSKIISAAEDGKSPSERVQIRCVIYSDGSWWKDVSARENECEFLWTTMNPQSR